MKKSSPLYLVLALMVVFIYGCERKEELKQPVADFSFTPATDIAPGEVVTFTNLSTDATDYTWNFDDGTDLINAQHPQHKFAAPGVYNVLLIAENRDYQAEIYKEVTVISPVTACFTFDPSTAVVGENVTFVNCSEGADSYEWYQIGNPDLLSTDKDPEFPFPSAGTYEIKLVAISGSSTDEVIHSITITENPIVIDPTAYWPVGVSDWNTEYYNDFSASGDWYEGTGEDFQLTIDVVNGYYTMIDNNDTPDHLGYTITNDNIETPSDNFDLEVKIRNTVDNGNYGSGLLFGGDGDGSYNYYSFSIGYYAIGNTDTDGVWRDWTATTNGTSEDWNKLTVRKYQNKYYFFINEVFLYSHDYSSYGSKFGFTFDKNTTVDIDAVGIYTMIFSTGKTVNKKQQVNTAHGKMSGTLKNANRIHSVLK